MNKAFNKIGFLMSGSGGNPSGIGDYVRTLDSAGIPAVVMCNDGDVGLSDVFALWESGSTVPHICAYRVVKDGSEHYAVPNYHDDPLTAAELHWSKILKHIPPSVQKHRDKVWILPINEVDKERSDWLGWFALHTATLAYRDGYKIAMFGWSSGEPEYEHWQTEGMRTYLDLCAARPNQAAVCLHEYSYTKANIKDGYPYKVGRYRFLFDACDEMGIKRPNIMHRS